MRFIGKKSEPIAEWTDSNRKNAESYTKWAQANH